MHVEFWPIGGLLLAQKKERLVIYQNLRDKFKTFKLKLQLSSHSLQYFRFVYFF